MKKIKHKFYPTKFNVPSNLLTDKERIEVRKKRIAAAKKGAKTKIKNKEFSKLYAPTLQKDIMSIFEAPRQYTNTQKENENKIWWFIGTIDEKISHFANSTGIARDTITKRLAEHISSS